MKHQNPEELIAKATILAPGSARIEMSRVDRLKVWADALEKHSGDLNALREIEYLRKSDLRAYCRPDTPMTVAYDQPKLRAAGLGGDTLGEAMDFFGMSNGDAHLLLCDCHYRGSMSGPGLAYRVRRYAQRIESGSLWQRAVNFVTGRRSRPAAERNQPGAEMGC